MKVKEYSDYHDYFIAEKEIKMCSHPDVWSPYSAQEMLSFLVNYGYLEEIEQYNVLDLGTGSGIIGIFCGLLGAKEITLSDYSGIAAELAVKNASLNNIQAKGIQSNCFKSFSKKDKYNLIISNPPVQPWLFTDVTHPEERMNSASWNEAGADGRLVLDSLIMNGEKHLANNGILITSSSSRHGHTRTKALFQKYWKNQWRQIYSAEHRIDANYHKPYMPAWLHLQGLDLDLRVYQKDAQGREFALQTTEQGEKILITTLNLENENIPVKMIWQKNKWEVFDQSGQNIQTISPKSKNLPDKAIDNHWYYKYFLIQTEI